MHTAYFRYGTPFSTSSLCLRSREYKNEWFHFLFPEVEFSRSTLILTSLHFILQSSHQLVGNAKGAVTVAEDSRKTILFREKVELCGRGLDHITLSYSFEVFINKSQTVVSWNVSRQSSTDHQWIPFRKRGRERVLQWSPPSKDELAEDESEVHPVRPSSASTGDSHPDDCHHLCDGFAKHSFDALLRDASERGAHILPNNANINTSSST